jgi:hypothetical protein
MTIATPATRQARFSDFLIRAVVSSSQLRASLKYSFSSTAFVFSGFLALVKNLPYADPGGCSFNYFEPL